jgi:hypothetical protein
MTTDYRALCAELLGIFEKYDDESNLGGIIWDMKMDGNDLLERARAALAQPEPEPVAPSKHELFSLLMHVGGATQCVSIGWLEPFADAVLARWGRPAIEPVPGVEGADA